MKFNPLNPTSKDKSVRRHMLKDIDRRWNKAKSKALSKKADDVPTYKKYEGKVQREVAGESRSDQIKRINHHVAMSGAISRARDRHERRHKGKKGTTLAERLESNRQMSKDR